MKEVRYTYALLTGADLGNREDALNQAYSLIGERIGSIKKASNLHETEPWGFESDTKFLNQAILVESTLKPEEVLARILEIELEIGRIRGTTQWASRIIDIDILCAENIIHHSDTLNIPHKHLHERSFALKPLCEIAPGWTHPLLRKSYLKLLAEIESPTVETVA